MPACIVFCLIPRYSRGDDALYADGRVLRLWAGGSHGRAQYGYNQYDYQGDKGYHKPYAAQYSLGRAVADAAADAENEADKTDENKRIKSGEMRCCCRTECCPKDKREGDSQSCVDGHLAAAAYLLERSHPHKQQQMPRYEG